MKWVHLLNQQEFLNLYNKDEGQTDQRNLTLKKKAIAEITEGDTEKAVKALKVIGIYDTNSFEGGLRLKTSRFNHSCWPNAYVGIENEIRATYNIKVGQEITINYRLHIKIFFRKNQRNVKYVCLKYDLGEYLCTQSLELTYYFLAYLHR